MSAGRQIRQASKQTTKNKQCGSNHPKGVPQANSHDTWALARQRGYLWPIANWEQRYSTYLQRKIRTVPVRSEDGETRLGDRGLLRARASVTVQAAGDVGGRRPVPIGGRWRFAGAGRDRPATHARACVVSSLRCRSDRRLRVRAPAQAVMRRGVGQAAGCRVKSVGVKTRRCAGALCSTCCGDRRRCRVAPTSSGFDYPCDKAKAGTRVRVCRRGSIPCLRARAQVEAQRHCLSGGALPRGGKPRGYGPGECGRGVGGGGRRARRRSSRAASRQGRQGRWLRARAAGRQGRQARWRRARAARPARPAARATSPLAPVASPAAKRGGGKGGKAGEPGGGGDDDKGGEAGNASGLPCGACRLAGGAAATAGGAGDLPCGAPTTAGGASDLPCGYVRGREGFARGYQHGGQGSDGG